MSSSGILGSGDELSELQAEFCKAMAHPKRIRILRVLGRSEKSVTELVRLTGTTQSNMSQHLSIMRELGLLRTRRSGSMVYYSVADERITEACEIVRACVSERVRKAQLVLLANPPGPQRAPPDEVP